MNKNCFACKGNGKCLILRKGSRCDEKCRFFKTSAQYEADRKASDERLASLPETTQRYISDTYYLGRGPWRKGAGQHDC